MTMKTSKQDIGYTTRESQVIERKQNTQELRCFEFSSKLNAGSIKYFKRIVIRFYFDL